MVREICKAPGCSNKRGQSAVSFFKFPTSTERAKVWCSRCCISYDDLKSVSYLCSLHFDEDQFSTKALARKLLKPLAVPKQIKIAAVTFTSPLAIAAADQVLEPLELIISKEVAVIGMEPESESAKSVIGIKPESESAKSVIGIKPESESAKSVNSCEGNQQILRKSRKVIKKRKTETCFIAIHLGCGRHSLKERHQEQYKQLCQTACTKALKVLESGGSADDAVTVATTTLENCDLINAGKGSELNLEKKVECDAGFMNGTGCFGGVGCVPGVPNPILVARKIAQLQLTRENLMEGVIPPNLLTGSCAKAWAASHGIPTCKDDQLISERAVKNYEKYEDRIFKSDKTRQNCKDIEEGEKIEVNDTVGAIALDFNDHVAATVSSGGNQFKFPGRVGHCPLFGCGCWAQDKLESSDYSVAISTTGVGEMLTKTRWAFECANCLTNQDHDNPMEAVRFAIKNKFLESPLLRLDSGNKLIGGIGLIWDGKHGEFLWGYKAPTFVFSYASNNCPKPEVNIMSKDENEIYVGGMDF